MFEEKHLTADEQKNVFVNKKNFQLKYCQFNLVIKLLIILNLYLKKKTAIECIGEDEEHYKEMFKDLVNDLTNKLSDCIQMHKMVFDENKNQLK